MDTSITPEAQALAIARATGIELANDDINIFEAFLTEHDNDPDHNLGHKFVNSLDGRGKLKDGLGTPEGRAMIDAYYDAVVSWQKRILQETSKTNPELYDHLVCWFTNPSGVSERERIEQVAKAMNEALAKVLGFDAEALLITAEDLLAFLKPDTDNTDNTDKEAGQ